MKSFYYLSLITFIVASCNTTTNTQQSQTVNDCYDQYKSAVLNRDGEKAFSKLDKQTIERLNKNIRHAQTGDYNSLRFLPFIDKVMILTLRHNFNNEDINAMTADRLFSYGVQTDQFGLRTIESLDLDVVEETGTTGKATIAQNGKSMTYAFFFNKEDGEWKINLESMLQLISSTMKRSMAPGTESENDHILAILEKRSGKTVNSNIWDLSTQ